MRHQGQGTLIAIGGHEAKNGAKAILAEVARRVGAGKLVVTTVASADPEGLFEEYQRVFRNLGLRHVFKLPIAAREEARSRNRVEVLDEATGVFITGGDQLKLTSQIGDTPIFQRIQEIYRTGGLIAGTSAGASVLCETMLVSGEDRESARVSDTVRMAPGLGLVDGLIIDQHFAQRGRMGRLLGAVAQNPKALGIGIDENTALIIKRDRSFYVLGRGAVYVLDGSPMTFSNIAEVESDHSLSVFDVRLHVLSQGDRFDLRERRPGKLSPRAAKELAKPDGEG